MNSESERILQFRKKMISALRKGNGIHDNELAEKLSECDAEEGRQCNQPMCPICVSELRLMIFIEWLKCTVPFIYEPKLQCAVFSQALRHKSYPIGRLDQVDMNAINQEVQRQYERLGLPLAFSSVDVSLIEDLSQKPDPCWQAGVYSVVFGIEERARKKLEYMYPGSRTMPRSVYLPENTLPKVRQWVYEGVERDGWTSILLRVVHNQIHEGPMRPAQRRELAHCLARYEMPVRYVLTGCQLCNDEVKLNPGVRRRLEVLASS